MTRTSSDAILIVLHEQNALRLAPGNKLDTIHLAVVSDVVCAQCVQSRVAYLEVGARGVRETEDADVDHRLLVAFFLVEAGRIGWLSKVEEDRPYVPRLRIFCLETPDAPQPGGLPKLINSGPEGSSSLAVPVCITEARRGF